MRSSMSAQNMNNLNAAKQFTFNLLDVFVVTQELLHILSPLVELLRHLLEQLDQCIHCLAKWAHNGVAHFTQAVTHLEHLQHTIHCSHIDSCYQFVQVVEHRALSPLLDCHLHHINISHHQLACHLI